MRKFKNAGHDGSGNATPFVGNLNGNFIFASDNDHPDRRKPSCSTVGAIEFRNVSVLSWRMIDCELSSEKQRNKIIYNK